MLKNSQQTEESDHVTTIDALPSSVLALIFLAAGGRQFGATLACVCKRWRAVYKSEGCLWRSFQLKPSLEILQRLPVVASVVASGQGPYDINQGAIHPACNEANWLSAARATLEVAAPHVQSFSASCQFVHGADEMGGPIHDINPAGTRLTHSNAGIVLAELPAMLGMLCPYRLTSLRLNCSVLADPSQRGAVPLPAITGPALRRFPRLACLELRLDCMTAEDGPALASLTALRSLRLRACSKHHEIPLAVLQAAVGLTGLTELHVLTMAPTTALPPFASLPRLQRLRLDVLADQTAPLEVPPMHSLPALRTWLLGSFGGVKLGGGRVRACNVSYTESGGAKLELNLSSRIAGGAAKPLAALLQAAVPQGTLQRLHVFELWHSELGSEQCNGCAAHLQHLTALSLLRCTPPDGLGALLAALLPQTPLLRSLNINGCRADGGQLPPALCQLTGLQELTLRTLGLEGLPPGPYLSGLTRLRIEDFYIVQFPAALRSATNLRSLDLAGCRIQLSDGDVRSTLSQLRLLRDLVLSRRPTEAVQRALLQAIPGLHLS